MNNVSADLAASIEEMEKQCFPGDAWSFDSIKSTLAREDIVCGVIFDGNNAPIGYYIAASGFGETELYRIAVLPSQRRRGYGKLLMEKLLKSCPKDTEKIFLEVRESNKAAIGLYEKNGFEIISRRKNYYGNEDGLVYRLTLVEI